MEPPSRPSSGPSPGDVIAGKFRLERLVGRGGMGTVWAGRHLQLDMVVALKFIEHEPDGDREEARSRFEREARAAAQIRSPHVVHILDHGIDGDRPYIAMELLLGEDLGQRLRRERRIGVAAASRIVTQAAKALRRAHEAGIIHRDLKPGNVFLARFDDDEVVKLLDFGVAKMRRAGAIEEKLATQVGIVFGSPSYMSPEQARGVRVIDHRADLWSLAVILFRAVTGVKPFQGASIADLVVKLCVDPLPVATRVAPDLPPSIDGFFERAFARDPDHRFASAPELAAAFEEAVAPAPAPPTSTARAGAEPALQVASALPPAAFVPPSSGGGLLPASTPRPPQTTRRSPGRLVLATSLGGAAIFALVITLAARRGPSSAGVSSAPEPLPPATPPPPQSAEEPTPAPSLSAPVDAVTSAAPAPKRMSPAPRGPLAPPTRPPRRRPPN